MSARVIHVSIAKEVPTKGLGDLRTVGGRMREIRAQVEMYGGYSIFWVTQIANRAKAAEIMEKSGEVIRLESAYPWIAAKMREAK